jgi:antitoxin ParD1/3/4
MADRSELRVILKPALADVVPRAIETGAHFSQDEVVSEAFLEWRLRRALNPSERDALGRLWDEGAASGPGRFGSMDEIRHEARRRWTEQQVRRQADGWFADRPWYAPS